MERCMSALTEEYPDEEQRLAVCFSQWRGTEGREYRHLQGEVRAVEEGDEPRISGYAAVFNKLSQPLSFGFRERIRPGAFTKTIKDGDIRALFNHDPNYVLGRTKAGTLELREDDNGLAFDIHAPDEPWVRSLIASIKRGDINQASFAFDAVQEEWSQNEKQPVRELREVKLYDVSPVTYPAYLETSTQAREMRALRAELAVYRSLEQSEPLPTHSESEPLPTHSEQGGEGGDGPGDAGPSYPVRPMSVLVREYRITREQGRDCDIQLKED